MTAVRIPQLGVSVDDVLHRWRDLDIGGRAYVPGMRLVGWSIFDGTRFDWMDGVLWRLYDASGAAPGHRRIATHEEQQCVRQALSDGAFQIQLEPSRGITGHWVTPPLAMRIYHRATGRSIP